MMGSEQDLNWRNFPQALTETQGARRYVALFEAPFQASVLNECESTALWASSLLAMPPPPPRTTPLTGLTTVDLTGSNLTQWASHVQDVASGMILPQVDIVGVLNCLKSLTPVRYCHFFFGVGWKCRCGNVPRQTSSLASGLWMPPMMSYPAMASPSETTASSSMEEVPPLRHPPMGLSPVVPATISYSAMASLPEAVAGFSASGVPLLRHSPPGPPPGIQVLIDTLLALTTENLLATAGVGRGGRGRRSTATGPRAPTAPGP